MVSADTGVWSYSSHCGASVLLSKGQNNLWRDFCLKWCLPWIKLAQKGFNKGDIILWSLLRWKDAYFLDILTDGFHWGWSGLIYPHLLKRVLFLSTSACHLVNCLALPNIFHWVLWKHLIAPPRRDWLRSQYETIAAFYSERSPGARRAGGNRKNSLGHIKAQDFSCFHLFPLQWLFFILKLIVLLVPEKGFWWLLNNSGGSAAF